MKSNIDNIVKPKAGDPITESMLTSVIDSIDAMKSRLGADNTPEYVNPAIVRCVNGLNDELPIFSVVHLGNATITDRSFFNSSGGATQDARIRATQPTGAEDEPFGVIRSAVGPGFEVSAVCSGFTCCRIKVDNANQENYKYAKPIENVTGFFQAAESGPCLIVWKESGIGVKWAYVIIDRRGSKSNVYLLTLERDIPPAVHGCDGEICVTRGRAIVMDRAREGSSGDEYDDGIDADDCVSIVPRYRLAEYVYNNTPKWFRAKDSCGRKILYYGYRDEFDTIWLDRTYWKMPRIYCNCSSSSSSSSSSSGSSSSMSSSSDSSFDDGLDLCCKETGDQCLQEYIISIRQKAFIENGVEYPEINATITGWLPTADLPLGPSSGGVFWQGLYNEGVNWPYACDMPKFYKWDSDENRYTVILAGYGQKCCFDSDHISNPSDPDNLCYMQNMWNKLTQKGLTFGTHS